MNARRRQGTRHESWLVSQLKAAGLASRRLAEGGTKDEGDAEAWLPDGRWVIEAKARSSLNVQETLGSARRKAAEAAGEPVPVAVVWRRLVRVPGKQVRQPVAGERVVVVLGWDDFVRLARAASVPAVYQNMAQNSPQEGDISGTQ